MQQVGWKVLDIASGKKKARDERRATRGGRTDSCLLISSEGQPQDVLDVEVDREEDAAAEALHGAHAADRDGDGGQNARRERALRRDEGERLGTPATRAPIIEVLLKRGLHRAHGQEPGGDRQRHSLIEVVHPEVKSPAMTGPVGSVSQAH